MPVVLRVNGYKFFFYEADVAMSLRISMLAKKETKRNSGLTLLKLPGKTMIYLFCFRFQKNRPTKEIGNSSPR